MTAEETEKDKKTPLQSGPQNEQGTTALIMAAEAGHTNVVRQLLEIDPNSKDIREHPVLGARARADDVVRQLLEVESDVNVKDNADSQRKGHADRVVKQGAAMSQRSAADGPSEHSPTVAGDAMTPRQATRKLLDAVRTGDSLAAFTAGMQARAQ